MPIIVAPRALRTLVLALAAGGVALTGVALAGDSLPVGVQTLQSAYRQPLSDADSQTLGQALEAARRSDVARARELMEQLSDPLARKIALWAIIDTDADGMSYAELELARRDLADWPGAAKREAAVEKVIEGGGLSPQGIIAWFGGAQPTTPEGAMALASAYQSTGQTGKAAEVIRRVWRTYPFDAGLQQQMLGRFGALLTSADDAAREDMLLYGAQGEAARALLPLLSPDQQALAEARMSVRAGEPDADSKVDALPPDVRDAPGLDYELALRADRRGDTADALDLLPALAQPLPNEEDQARMWKLRKHLVVTALEAGNARGAYRAAADSGVDDGANGAEAEFYAGWLALTRLNDPRLADRHFAKVLEIGSSPITESRGLYWRGRAAEAEGDIVDADLFYSQAAHFQTAFYGQLAAAKIGQTKLDLGGDPVITVADRRRFDDREPVRAARILADIGARETFGHFVAGLAETLKSAADAAQLVDLVRGYGDQELSMLVVRIAAQHDFVLPIRGYPMRDAPEVADAPETALVLGIVRQESGFDPHVRSPVGALGMMQLMPGTAHIIARKLGYTYSASRLEDPGFNMQLGSSYLGQLVNQFGGSYVMATAAYNAGPGRPTEWTTFCGDPRSASTDPANYIECIPFSETRNYVMRVLEAMEVYRARLAGGQATVSLAADLRRGGFGYGGGAANLTASAAPVGAGR